MLSLYVHVEYMMLRRYVEPLHVEYTMLRRYVEPLRVEYTMLRRYVEPLCTCRIYDAETLC